MSAFVIGVVSGFHQILSTLFSVTVQLAELFKDNMCNIKCDKCDKVYEDFIVAYTLFRALKITGWDYEYIEYVNSKIEDLQAALTAAESGNCKCC